VLKKKGEGQTPHIPLVLAKGGRGGKKGERACKYFFVLAVKTRKKKKKKKETQRPPIEFLLRTGRKGRGKKKKGPDLGYARQDSRPQIVEGKEGEGSGRVLKMFVIRHQIRDLSSIEKKGKKEGPSADPSSTPGPRPKTHIRVATKKKDRGACPAAS